MKYKLKNSETDWSFMKNIEKIYGVPHFHFDLQWWKTEEAYSRDVKKILDKALELLDKDDEFKYTIDQVTALKPFVESNEERMAKISSYVKDGRIELVGGTWGAPDENIPTGEALIRQFLHGKRYIRRNFGADVKVAWEIDEFGHPHQLPQILKKSGFDYFVFSRGVQPWFSLHDLDFYWEAPDGSKILTHWFAGHYVGMMGFVPLTKIRSTDRMVDELKNRIKYEGGRTSLEKLMVPFGTDFGVPRDDWLDFPEVWRSQMSEEFAFSTPSEFFGRIRGKKLRSLKEEFNPVFTGCYESREKVKKNCRETQNRAVEAEKLASIAYILGWEYPHEEFNSIWLNILKNDFHDTISGTETDRNYRRTLERYKVAEILIWKAMKDSLDFLVRKIDTSGRGEPLIVFNTLNWARSEVVSAEIEPGEKVEVCDGEGRSVPSQIEDDRIYFKAEVPSFGYRVYFLVPYKEEKTYDTDLVGDARTLENSFYKIEIDQANGYIKSLYDKEAQKEILATKERYGNELVAEEDVGSLWTVLKTGKEYGKKLGADVKLIEDGPVRKVVEAVGSHEGMKRIQRIYLYFGMRRIDFETEIYFEGKDRRIKTVFQLKNGGKNYFETPFYVAEREVGHWPAQNWAEISDGSSGFALINAGNPGYEIFGNTISMTLLRSISVLPFRLPEFILKNLGDLWSRIEDAIKMSMKGLYVGEHLLYPYHGLLLREFASEGGPEPENGWTLIDHLLPYLTFWRESDAWERRRHLFKYAIYPHEGDWKDARLPRRGYELNNPLIVRRTRSNKGELPPKFSFFSSRGADVILSTLKKAEEGNALVARFYETKGEGGEVSIEFFREVKDARKISMTEDKVREKVKTDGRFLKTDVDGHGIETVSFSPL